MEIYKDTGMNSHSIEKNLDKRNLGKNKATGSAHDWQTFIALNFYAPLFGSPITTTEYQDDKGNRYKGRSIKGIEIVDSLTPEDFKEFNNQFKKR